MFNERSIFVAGKQPFYSQGVEGANPSEASFGFGGRNEREALRGSILGLRRALWRVESALGVLEARAHGSINPDQMRPQFAEMFRELEHVMEEFYGLSLGVYGFEFTVRVVTDFNQPFDYIRKMRSGGG